MRFRTYVISALILVICGLLAHSAQAAPVDGAIFTTTANGSRVNANQYSSKCEVYLDGGPGPNAPADAAGLPDGEYYFQVTDASGRELLSTDVVTNRRLQVTNGVIAAYTGVGGPLHPLGYDRDHPELGAITIRLADATCPTDYKDSRNGVYKVWITTSSDFVGDASKVDNDCGNGCFHGFLPSKSKTDNFKTATGTGTFCVSVWKRIVGAGGVERPGANWKIFVTDPLNPVNNYYTGEDGFLRVCGLTEGTYTVAEENQEGFFPVALIVNGTALATQPVYSFFWSPGRPEPVIIFKNKDIASEPQ
jgi:hypothetical protein